MILLPPKSTLTDTLFPYPPPSDLEGAYRRRAGRSECLSPDRALDAPFRWPDRTGRKIHQRDLCMSLTVITEERNIANALISGLANMAETPTREQEIGRGSCRERVCQYV